MATQIEYLKEQIADLEASNGVDAPFVKLLKQQLAGMQLNLHNKNERFLVATGSPQEAGSASPSGETEAEEDEPGAIRAEAIRRERVRRMAAAASGGSPATPTDKSKAQQGPTRGSSK